MKKCILIPDSFKGTMSSTEVCKIMASAIKKFYPDAEICNVPVADGGEGTVDAFLQAAGGKKIRVYVKNPYFEEIPSFYGILPDGTAVIEMAAAAGLPLAENRRHAELTTTYGVGQLIMDAVSAGCKKLILGLGGSATNDGGCGAAAALGAVFRKADGTSFIPVGQSLQEIASVDLSSLQKRMTNISVLTMCDIDNPLCGPEGAAAVFAPQKGADEKTVRMLDRGLSHLAEILRQQTGIDITRIAGAGAAGGMGGGMAAFFQSPLQSGIEIILDTVHFNEMLENTDLVFTGEGKLDSQSMHGKVVDGVAHRTKAAGVPLIAVVGDIEGNAADAYAAGVSAVFSINRQAIPFERAKLRCKSDLALTMENLMRTLKCFTQK